MSDPSPPKKRRIDSSFVSMTSISSSMNSVTSQTTSKAGGGGGGGKSSGTKTTGEPKSRLPPTPNPLPEGSAAVMPYDVVSNLLTVACAKGIRQAGFTGWTPMAGERVMEMVEQRILEYTKLIHRSMIASRRIRPAPDDFIFAIPDFKEIIQTEALKTHTGQIPTWVSSDSLIAQTPVQTQTPPITPPESTTKTPTPAPAPTRKRKRPASLFAPHSPLLLTPPSSPMFKTTLDKKFLPPGPPPGNAKFPRYLPPMPPAHTYKFTPTYIREFGNNDNRQARERVREEARKGEKALRSLIGEISAANRRSEEGEKREEERSGKRRKERDELWRECFEKLCGGGEGDGEGGGGGMEQEKGKKKRKKEVEVLPEPVNWERDRYWRKVARKGGFGTVAK